MWLSEKVTFLEKENGEMKKALLEMEAKIELQAWSPKSVKREHFYLFN